MKIILFDGLCKLCNSSVHFILKRDRKEAFKFASLQSAVGQSLLARFGIQNERIDSIVYIKYDKYFIRSSAVLNILKDLGSFWKVFYVLIIVPRFIRDLVYNTISKSRYKVFGKRESCMIPTDSIKSRFF